MVFKKQCKFLAHKVENLIKRGVFENEEKFLKGAIKEMVRKYEIQELNKKMDNFAQKMAKRHPKNLSEAESHRKDSEVLNDTATNEKQSFSQRWFLHHASW